MVFTEKAARSKFSFGRSLNMEKQRSLQDLADIVRIFCEARDWDQFHGPKDLAIGVITEASELLEHFRFQTDEQSMALLDNQQVKGDIEDELADVLFFLLRFSQRFEVDLTKALLRKIEKSEKKYPVEKAKGKNTKYTKL
jgi:NTP pyrophosphatase (non-canonical NTP hydrolase)